MKIKLLLSFLLLLPMQASALTAQQGLQQAAEGNFNTSRNIPQVIALVVNAVLSLLAIIFIVLIVLGGFRWMTSAGNATKIETAKETITNAVIGLVVVLAAYAISEFILRALTESTSGGGGDVVS
ncbi:hypothetical protein HN670_03175 [bacterium]|jgi:TRAP-type C4-dicarboxylate transport system permease small subunit|nr:hypothetical protein [bacterium]